MSATPTLARWLRTALRRLDIEVHSSTDEKDREARLHVFFAEHGLLHAVVGRHAPRLSVAAHLETNDEGRSVFARLSFVWASVAIPRRWREVARRQVGFSLSWDADGAWAHWCLWANPNSSRSGWRQGRVDLATLVFGRVAHRGSPGERVDVVVPMPEGSYPAQAQKYVGTWTRPRWPFPTTITTVEIEVPGGIPIPGKGENAWDCGDDAVFSRSTSARTIEEAIGGLVASVLATRMQRNGTHDWPRTRGAS